MKKILYIFPFFLIYNYVFSQVNMLDSTCIWSEINSGCYMQTCWNYYYKYSIDNSDTIINQKKYFKVRERGIRYNETDNEPMSGYSYDTSYTNYIKGFLRTDSNKFYYFDYGNTTENILWDFNLKVGDNVKSYYGTISSPVISIDSVIFNGIYVKRFFSNFYNQYLIEGIGCSSGLFGVFGNSLIETGSSLFCFKNKYDLFVVDTLNCSNSLTVGLNNNIILNDINLNVFPNPVKKRLTIELQETSNFCTLSICNINGQELIKKQIIESKTNVDISILKSGVYFVKLISDKSVTVKKIIKE